MFKVVRNVKCFFVNKMLNIDRRRIVDSIQRRMASSVKLRLDALVRIDVSEERSAFTIRVTIR
jgi:hypothetical protein